MNDTVIELSNIEIHEHCMLNKRTGEREYSKGKKQIPYFTGLYFKAENTFFALYPTENGPIMYYEGKEYPKSQENFVLKNIIFVSNIVLHHILDLMFGHMRRMLICFIRLNNRIKMMNIIKNLQSKVYYDYTLGYQYLFYT